jgi:hypothetical protein
MWKNGDVCKPQGVLGDSPLIQHILPYPAGKFVGIGFCKEIDGKDALRISDESIEDIEIILCIQMPRVAFQLSPGGKRKAVR